MMVRPWIPSMLLAGALACPALGQPVPTWNRRAMAISVIPIDSTKPGGGAGGPLYEVRGFFSLSAAHLASPVDLSTRIEYRRNGITIGSEIIVRTGLPSGALGCTGLGCEDTDLCICDCSPPPCICECGPVVITSAGMATELTPGDEITIILYPAPGAAPESTTTDDQRVIAYNGTPMYWHRFLRPAPTLVRSSLDGGGTDPVDVFFDIEVRVELVGHYEGFLHLPTRIRIEGAAGILADVLAAGHPDPYLIPCPGACPGAGCMFTEVISGQCRPDSESLIPCPCRSFPITTVIPMVPLSPGDEITVILYPAPGGLPPPPPLMDAALTLLVPCPEDCNPPPDGQVNVADLLALLAQWNSSTAACDINDDGIVDLQDLLAMLAAWGAC